MTTGLLLVFLALATYRAWRLLAVDTILDRPRARFYRHVLRSNTKLVDGWECPFCLGLWLAIAAVAVCHHLDLHLPLVAAWPLAVNALAALTATVVARFED